MYVYKNDTILWKQETGGLLWKASCEAFFLQRMLGIICEKVQELHLGLPELCSVVPELHFGWRCGTVAEMVPTKRVSF